PLGIKVQVECRDQYAVLIVNNQVSHRVERLECHRDATKPCRLPQYHREPFVRTGHTKDGSVSIVRSGILKPLKGHSLETEPASQSLQRQLILARANQSQTPIREPILEPGPYPQQVIGTLVGVGKAPHEQQFLFLFPGSANPLCRLASIAYAINRTGDVALREITLETLDIALGQQNISISPARVICKQTTIYPILPLHLKLELQTLERIDLSCRIETQHLAQSGMSVVIRLPVRHRDGAYTLLPALGSKQEAVAATVLPDDNIDLVVLQEPCKERPVGGRIFPTGRQGIQS